MVGKKEKEKEKVVVVGCRRGRIAKSGVNM
jgi:hypothetical protein